MRLARLAVLIATAALAVAASPASGAVVINEVESQAPTGDDWIELYNTGPDPVTTDLWTANDDNPNNPYSIPGQTINAGAFAFIQLPSNVNIGNPDTITVFDKNGGTIATFANGASHASQTFGRCPDGTGTFQQTRSTPGAANFCIPAGSPWPGGADVAAASSFNFEPNLSGLAYQPSGTRAKGVLWASRNNGAGIVKSALFRLVHNGSSWVPDGANGWASGKELRFPDGSGVPDAEGLALVTSDAGAVYASIERNDVALGGEDDIPRPGILRFDVTGSGTTLNATKEWALQGDLGLTDSNGGLEALAWIPDSVLVAKGFKDEVTGTAYSPASYPDHGTGVFFVGVEQTGEIRAYALNQTAGTAVKIATIVTPFPAVMSLDYEPERGVLWAACDDTCDGKTATYDVAATGVDAGKFVRTAVYDRPGNGQNLNNEGLTIAPQLECVGGKKPVYYADDSNTGSISLRSGTLNCTVIDDPGPDPSPTPTPTPTPTATASPTPAATATATASPTPAPSASPTPSPTPSDRTKPKLSNVKAKRTQVAFKLSENAKVTVTIERKVGKRFKRVKRFTVSLKGGTRTIKFKGRAPASALRPGAGTLRITLQATDAAKNKSAATRKSVR